MKINIVCHGCSHRFQRTAAQVLSEGRCPRCASTDIDADDMPRTAAGPAPTGRSDYKPGSARMGEPTPQTDPDSFSSEDILAEIKYLMRLNKQHGTNHLRTMKYLDLLQILKGRGYTGSKLASGDFDISEYGEFGGDGAGAWPGAYEEGYYDGYLWGMGDREAQKQAPDAPTSYKRGYSDGHADAKAGKQPRTLIEEIKAAASRKTAAVGWYATTDQMGAAAGYLSREWGDHGYGIKQADEEGVFDCIHSDGSRFQIRADRWGNTSDVKQASRHQSATDYSRFEGDDSYPYGDSDESNFDIPQCPACGGSPNLLGNLGKVTWWRCRDCGIEYQGDAPRIASRRIAGENFTHLQGITSESWHGDNWSIIQEEREGMCLWQVTTGGRPKQGGNYDIGLREAIEQVRAELDARGLPGEPERILSSSFGTSASQKRDRMVAEAASLANEAIRRFPEEGR
jgi:predicted Zn-ribbon and HTH transcriptional regulator